MSKTKSSNKNTNQTELSFIPKKPLSPPHIKNQLSYLVYTKNIEQIQFLLENSGVDINQQDKFGKSFSWTPLYWAVKLSYYDCAIILLEYGACVNTVVHDFDECCGTPLDLSILRGDKQMEEILREHAKKDNIAICKQYKAIRTKIRGKTGGFNFGYQKSNQLNVVN